MKKLVSIHTGTEKTQKDTFWETIDLVAHDELSKLTAQHKSPNDVLSGPINQRDFIVPPRSKTKRENSVTGQVEHFLFSDPQVKKQAQSSNPFETLLDSSDQSDSPYKNYIESIKNKKQEREGKKEAKFNVKYGCVLVTNVSKIIIKNKYEKDFFNSIQTDLRKTNVLQFLATGSEANIAQPELKSIFEGLLNDIISLNKMASTDSQAKEKLITVFSLISDYFHGNTGSQNLGSIREELYLNPQLREVLTRFDNQSCEAIKQVFEEKGKDKESLLILYVIARMRQMENGIAVDHSQPYQDMPTSSQSPGTPEISQKTIQDTKSEAQEEPLKTDRDAESLPVPPPQSQPKIDRRTLLTRQSATTVMDTPTYNDDNFKALIPGLARTFHRYYEKGLFESGQEGSDEDIQFRNENCLEICLSKLLRDEALLKKCHEDTTTKSIDSLLGENNKDWKTTYHRKLAKSLVDKIVEVRVRAEAQFRLEIEEVIQTHFLRDGEIKVDLTANQALETLGLYDKNNLSYTTCMLRTKLKQKEYRLSTDYSQLAPTEKRIYTYVKLDRNLLTDQYNNQEVDNNVLIRQVLAKINRQQTSYQVSVVRKVLDDMYLAQSRK